MRKLSGNEIQVIISNSSTILDVKKKIRETLSAEDIAKSLKLILRSRVILDTEQLQDLFLEESDKILTLILTDIRPYTLIAKNRTSINIIRFNDNESDENKLSTITEEIKDFLEPNHTLVKNINGGTDNHACLCYDRDEKKYFLTILSKDKTDQDSSHLSKETIELPNNNFFSRYLDNRYPKHCLLSSDGTRSIFYGPNLSNLCIQDLTNMTSKTLYIPLQESHFISKITLSRCWKKMAIYLKPEYTYRSQEIDTVQILNFEENTFTNPVYLQDTFKKNIISTAFNCDLSLIALYVQDSVYVSVYDTQTGLLKYYCYCKDNIYKIVFSESNLMATLTFNGTVKLWNGIYCIFSMKETDYINRQSTVNTQNAILNLKFSPDGEYLCILHNFQLTILRISNFEIVARKTFETNYHSIYFI